MSDNVLRTLWLCRQQARGALDVLSLVQRHHLILEARDQLDVIEISLDAIDTMASRHFRRRS